MLNIGMVLLFKQWFVTGGDDNYLEFIEKIKEQIRKGFLLL